MQLFVRYYCDCVHCGSIYESELLYKEGLNEMHSKQTNKQTNPHEIEEGKEVVPGVLQERKEEFP